MSREELDKLRRQIDTIDHNLLTLLKARMDVVHRIALVKKAQGTAIRDPARESQLLSQLMEAAVKIELDPLVANKVFNSIMECSRDLQARVSG